MPIHRALALLTLAACVDPVTDGVTTQAIVGGQTAAATDFPAVVALQHGNGNWFCSGVLVDKDWVLTSASCFDSTSATQARIGDANLTDGTTTGLTITISEIHKHPSFNPNAAVWNHDVAVLRLAQSVTDRTPAALKRTSTAVGSAVTQAGFGTNNNNGNGGGILRSLATSTMDCASANDSGITNANLLCFNAADGTGSCYGDGGAPAFVGGAVAGVGSGGTGSSCTSGLDIYTQLLPELAFIDGYVPVSTTQPPPQNNPTTPPSGGNPDGSGTNDPNGGTRDPDGGSDGHGPTQGVGCSTSRGGAAWLVVLALAIPMRRRRRRRAPR